MLQGTHSRGDVQSAELGEICEIIIPSEHCAPEKLSFILVDVNKGDDEKFELTARLLGLEPEG